MDKKVLFEALNTELAKENIDLEIICVGGFVLEYYNLRGTQDVDATIKLEVHSLKSVLYFCFVHYSRVVFCMFYSASYNQI